MRITTAAVRNDGADIVYDRQGDGPALLMIAGGGGDAIRHAAVASLLADEYTVVSYDRRCNSRSSGDPTVDLDMAQQADDAAAVIRASGAREAYVFGNSGGASIAFELAVRHPELIAGLVLHEGPTVSLLPDARTWLTFADAVFGAYTARGAAAAMNLFATEFVGFTYQATESGLPPNTDFFFAHEYLPITTYVPDLATLAQSKIPTVTAVGRGSRDAYYARTARIQARLLGCPCIEFPGDHLGFIYAAEDFTDSLREVLRGFREQTPSAA
ncbi:alpha/beta fold hydrolase [Pseudonocardia spinosispora]|uniref:alpha/beta fold hydrolase n=1 Tax=Pseudonocardia spinosispora TaxID=103441 RepID=UPI0004053490|nr:alpha/beta hydrolase [Pseudonocardia spinosispora]